MKTATLLFQIPVGSYFIDSEKNENEKPYVVVNSNKDVFNLKEEHVNVVDLEDGKVYQFSDFKEVIPVRY